MDIFSTLQSAEGWRLFGEYKLQGGHLTKKEEQECFIRMSEGDKTAKNRLIEHNLRLVAHIAKKYQGSGMEADDLVSVGTIGLMKAVTTFRPEAGRLTTYASRCIENEILMLLRAGKKLKCNISLSDPVGADKEGNSIMVSDILGTDGDIVMRPLEESVDRQLLRHALSQLPDRERSIVSWRYGLGGKKEKTQKEVADLLGISQSYISRLEKRIMLRLRREIMKQLT